MSLSSTSARRRSRPLGPDSPVSCARRVGSGVTQLRYLSRPAALDNREPDLPDAPAQTPTRAPRTGQAPPVALPPVDVRRKRPPVLAFFLRHGDAAPRRPGRDAARARLRGALRRALSSRSWSRPCCATTRGRGTRRSTGRGTTWRSPTWSRCCCSRARACTPSRAERPGLSRIVSSLFQVMVVALVFALVNGEDVLQLLHLLRHARLRDLLHRLRPLGLRGDHRRPAAGRRLPAPRGARGLRPAHRGRRARAARGGARAGRDGRFHLAHPAAGQRAALARADRGPAERCSTPTASTR